MSVYFCLYLRLCLSVLLSISVHSCGWFSRHFFHHNISHFLFFFFESHRKAALASVSVNKEDVELIMSEFDMNFEKADLILRENGGDCVKAMSELIK